MRQIFLCVYSEITIKTLEFYYIRALEFFLYQEVNKRRKNLNKSTLFQVRKKYNKYNNEKNSAFRYKLDTEFFP